MKKINTVDLNEQLKENIALASLIKSNGTYLGNKFKDLKELDPWKSSEDTGVLYFIASYLSSENIKLSDNYLIVSDMDNSKKVYVFLNKKLYVFYFDKEKDIASVEVLDNYKKISFTLNYNPRKNGIYRLNNGDGYGFLNRDFNNVSSTVFENTINPDVSFVTLKLDFVDLKISFDNSNLDINSIIKYVEESI
ncbi:hypothetical protein ACP2XS_11080 [Staphylococcus epidermidis]|uniref:hypothetical protein n=1 Tax=Staphylococcus epidermidis TaxID=1282 RepID=UPI00290E93DE|nr:hypothetical protein [Staphylococcus epidermidis]MDU6617747.1 hypothetical protein [Staphylococcus epidermidis]